MDKRDRLRRPWSSITGRLILGVILVHAVLTPALFYGILLIVERSFESQFVDQVRNDMLLYSELFRPSVESRDEQKLADLLDETLIGGDVVYAEFIGPDGRSTRSESNGRGNTLVFREDFAFGEQGDRVYYIATRLFDPANGEPLGLLRLGFDEVSVREQIAAAYRFGSLIAAGYIVFSIALAIFFGRRFIQPVSSLRSLATSIAAGDRSVRFQADTNIFELQCLADDLQVMHKSLLGKQQEILDRELRLKAILNHAGDGILTVDDKGLIHSFNLAAESIFGYAANEVLGRNVAILMPAPDAGMHDAYIEQYLESGHSTNIGIGRRLEAQRKDGEIIPIQLTVSRVQQGPDVAFIGMIRDLSGEEKKDAELQQLSRAVEQSPVSIVITDDASRIEYVNPSFCQMTGYSADEVIGKNPRFLGSGHTPPDQYRKLWETLSRGRTWRGVFENRTKQGEPFWLSSTVCPVHDQAGQITNYISISEDITEARKKESMLAQAMKLEAIGRMTDGISHDFNNLLTIIRGNLKFLQDDLDTDNEDYRELIEDALSAAQDGADLIRRLLTFSRRQELDAQVIDINSRLIGMERLLLRSVPEINLELRLGEDIGNTFVDANRLESAILNLVTNARDAMPGGGTIVISTQEETVAVSRQDNDLPVGNYVVLSITDNGIGMDEQTRKQAIEPFFTTKTIETGTGLGLTMVHDFVQQCGGELRIVSEPKKGTTISMFLPSVRETSDLESNNESGRAMPTGDETILVVEDRNSVRRFACRTLERLGYRTLSAENAAQAMSILLEHDEIDLLFSDIVMPGEQSGRDLARSAAEARPGIRVLLTTGMEPVKAGSQGGDEDFPLLAKPYSTDDLARRVRDILDDRARQKGAQ